MNKVKFAVLAIVAAFATTAAASDIEFHGYTRAGIALSANGGTGMCYHLAGADTDYRLGNECDYVIEPNFEITMAKLDDKSTWGFHFMPKVYKRWQPMGGRDLDALAMWVGQVYFFGNNIPWLANGSLWAGRKYWDRLQLGINDQFLENEDSDSFGVENMDFGFAKFSFGFGLNKDGGNAGSNSTSLEDAASRRYKISARLTGIQTMNKDSSLQVWAAYYGQSENSEIEPGEVDSGWRIAAYHNFGFGSAGNLFVGGKVDKNTALSGYDGNGDGRTAWRVFAQYGVAVPAIRTSIDLLAEYRNSDFETEQGPAGNTFDKQTWITAGFRTDTQIAGPFRFLLEAGYDYLDKSPVTGESENLLKITPAIAISAGNDPWSRPTFRFYYTYANWSEVGVLDGWSSTFTQEMNGTDKSGSTIGVQAEGWW
ncbi:MAG TPA: carbohydrate porin [Gemmatimonadaceae bacterium]|nr:carbohydrate porin [Gemmatimonadaceae bacterium]